MCTDAGITTAVRNRDQVQPGPLTYECVRTEILGKFGRQVVSCQTTKVSTADNDTQFAQDLREGRRGRPV